MNDNLPPIFTRKDLAKYLRVSVETIDRWRDIGALKGFVIEGSVRFKKEEVLALIKRGEQK